MPNIQSIKEHPVKYVIISIVTLSVIAIATIGMYLWIASPALEEKSVGLFDEKITTTGFIKEEVSDQETATVDLPTALLAKVPIQLPTALVTYDYKKISLVIEYCGEYQKVIQDLRTDLDKRNLQAVQIDESKIIFTRTGECEAVR